MEFTFFKELLLGENVVSENLKNYVQEFMYTHHTSLKTVLYGYIVCLCLFQYHTLVTPFVSISLGMGGGSVLLACVYFTLMYMQITLTGTVYNYDYKM